MKKTVLSTLLSLLFSVPTFGQKGNVSTGGVATGIGGTACYSIGQTDYITATASTATITQGLQQPYEIQIMTGIESTEISLTTSIYPNPTSGLVFLKVEKSSIQFMSYTLTDLQGKILSQQKLADEKTNIVMTDLANGTYFITVTKNDKSLKSFKIIKTQ